MGFFRWGVGARTKQSLDNDEHRLLEAFSGPICPICEVTRVQAGAYLRGVLGDGVNDPKVRDIWRTAGGLCGRHWQEIRGLESPAYPASILTQDLLTHYLGHGRPELHCPACVIEHDTERRFVITLAKLPEAPLEPILREGRGFLCLRHLEMLPESPLRQRFVVRLQDILGEIEEFQRKNDWRYIDEPMGPEGDSWLRAMRALGGLV